MACFKDTFNKPFKISKGYVGINNNVYAEIWQIEPHKHELRILIRKPDNIAYRDIIWLSKRDFVIRGSFACTPIVIGNNYHINMMHTEIKSLQLMISDIPIGAKEAYDKRRYSNNKGIYPSIYSYANGFKD